MVNKCAHCLCFMTDDRSIDNGWRYGQISGWFIVYAAPKSIIRRRSTPARCSLLAARCSLGICVIDYFKTTPSKTIEYRSYEMIRGNKVRVGFSVKRLVCKTSEHHLEFSGRLFKMFNFLIKYNINLIS